MFTGLSLFKYLQNWNIELLKFPIFLIYDFTYLIPTYFFPEKKELLLDPQSYGYDLYSPFGALNSFFSLNINFGLVGTFFVLFLLGWFLSYLRKNNHSILFRVVYSMLSGCLIFTFFRDPFSVSVVKNMFEFSMVVPVMLLLTASLMSKLYLGNFTKTANGSQNQ